MVKKYILLFLMLFCCIPQTKCTEDNLINRLIILGLAGVSTYYTAKMAYQAWQRHRDPRAQHIQQLEHFFREKVFDNPELDHLRLAFAISNGTPEHIIEVLASAASTSKKQVKLPAQQYKVNFYGEKKIKSLENMSMASILARGNVEEISQCHPNIVCNYTHYLSFNVLKRILARWQNLGAFSQDYIKDLTRHIINQCCEDQKKRIKYLIEYWIENRYDQAQNPLTRQLLETIRNAKSFTEFPIELQDAVYDSTLKELDLRPADII